MAQRQTGGRGRAAVFLVISAMAALAAAAVIYTMINGLQQELDAAQKPDPTIQIAYAKQTLYQGQTLGEEDVELKEIAPEFAPETAFHSLEEVFGRVPAERILQGDVIRRERLADPEAGIGLNAIIPRGKRAMSINITDGSAVSGFLNPGNYVDVLVTIRGMKNDRELRTKTLLQGVKVLAVNSRVGANDVDGASRDGVRYQPSVTLALTLEEAEQVAHAHIEGAVTLTLRNDVDVTHVTTNGAKSDKLLGATEKTEVVTFKNVTPKKRPAGEQFHQLDIIRGSKVQHEKYKVPEGQK